jgi:lysophospholipase L1-like esterase
LKFLDEVQPQTILLMVGINDLIKGQSDEQVLDNYRQILQTLKQKHPKTELVVQSILPHGADRLAVEDREQVAKISNERIFQLNQKLSTLASENEVYFLNLYPLFADEDGLLRQDLSTDGLHLSEQGYLAWRSGMQVFDQLLLKQPEPKTAVVPTDGNKATEPKVPETDAPTAEVKPQEQSEAAEASQPEAAAEPAQ